MTGAITLSLEVLASRIMTPYFGVSLYIWAGILSITLIFLAVGYQLGGKVSQRLSREGTAYLFLAAPLASALAIVASTMIFPVLFPVLSQGHLVLGSFVGATLLLALPLIALSAMNPLLISLLRPAANDGEDRIREGDGGAGRIFFISTMGSVAGVLVTAFALIPTLTNFNGSLVLGICLCLLVLVFVNVYSGLGKDQARVLILLALMIGLICGALIVSKDQFLKRISASDDGGLTYTVVEEYTSVFGNIKVVQAAPKSGGGIVQRMFVQDGLMQNRTRLDHSSLSAYTGELEKLIGIHAPDAQDVLVLGLGAGIVPRNLSAEGKRLTVVEINPAALDAAVQHFGFPKDQMKVQLEDARTYVRKCDGDYDVAVVDLFLGDSVPDYLMTKEFFADVKSCLRSGGFVVMNAFFDSENPEPNGRLLATIAASFPSLYVSGASLANVYIVAGTTRPAGLTGRPVTNFAAFSRPHNTLLAPQSYQSFQPISDAHNIFSLLFSDANVAMRQYLAGELPAHILVN